jgi:osmotically-inducible protein OsmY
MSIYGIKRNWAAYAYLAPLVCGLGSIATSADAQNAAAPATGRAVSLAASTTQGGDWVADAELKRRVKAALHASPYLYDRHVTVSIQGDSVVLRGFVFSDWDLEDALRIARKAAGDRTVVDYLSIKEGGR